jgi:hypothetical protein
MEKGTVGKCDIIVNSNRCGVLRKKGECADGINGVDYVENCSGKNYIPCGRCQCESGENGCKKRKEEK